MTTKTTPKSKTSRKTQAAPRKTTTRAKTPTKKPQTAIVKEAQAVQLGAELKKRELLELVLKKADVKKKFAKPVVEAALEILGEAIAEGRPLNLQPMGKVMPQRTKDTGNSRVVIARIRQAKEKASADDATNSEPAVAAAAE